MSHKIEDRVWNHSKATGTALTILAYLAYRADNAGECWPSIATIARDCRLKDHRHVKRIIHEVLERELGELVVIPNGGRSSSKGGLKSNLYRVTVDATAEVPMVAEGPRSQDSRDGGLSSAMVVSCPVMVVEGPPAMVVEGPPESSVEPSIEERSLQNHQSNTRADRSESSVGEQLRTSQRNHGEGAAAVTNHISEIDHDAPARAAAFVKLHANRVSEEKFWPLLKAQRDYSATFHDEVFRRYARVRRLRAKRGAAERHGEVPGICAAVAA